MAHPRRRAEALRIQQDYPELDIEVVFDPQPDGSPATLRTARAVWAAVPDEATHHLVLQDDVLLCQDFPAKVMQCLRVAPAGALALFTSWSMASAQSMRLGALAGASWTRIVDDWAPTQALIMPASWAREFAEYAHHLPDWRPDNRAISTFLADRGREIYASIPSLVEHAPAPSLLFNDLLHGVRNATVFAGTQDMPPLSGQIAEPPALSYMWLGGGEFFSCYDPLHPGRRGMVTPTHEVLGSLGMTGQHLAEAFAGDRARHPDLSGPAMVGSCFHFSMWLTMFATGVIAGSMFDEPDVDVLTKAIEDQPWAAAAIATFPAAALRKIAPDDALHPAAAQLAPFCHTALQSGLAALKVWPELATLWGPGRFEIRPQWAREEADQAVT